ncbi:MAG: ABC transporter substrate-binding protein [Spirochaetales bacterium]|nr:ABC transporter substrate-binding protein [Spirochaetales bacterium]
MRKVLLSFLLLALLIPTVLFAAGDQEVETPGVTDDKILVGFSMPLSGPIGFIGSLTVDLTNAVFQKYNEEEGGIYGRKLELIAYDSGTDASQALANYRKLILEDEVFCVLFGFGSFVRPAYDFFAEQGVPWLFPMAPPYDQVFPPKKYLFSLFPTTATQMKTEAKWIIDQNKYKKIACIYGDSASGKTGLEGLRKELDGSGIEIVAAEALKEGSTSASVQVAKISKTDHDLVMIFGFTMQPAAVAIKEIRKVGLKSDIMINQPITNNTLLGMMEPEDVEGVYGSWWGALEYRADKPEASTPEMRAAAAVFDKYAPNVDRGQVEHSLSVELFIEALKRAGKDLTREGLVEAMESFDNYATGKGSYATFSKNRREGVAGGVIAQVQNGEWVEVSEWIDVEIDESQSYE